MKQHPLSRYVDDPVYFLFWPLPEAIPFIVSLLFGMYLNHFWTFLLVGFTVTYLLRKYNASQKPGYLIHFIYAWGLLLTKSKSFPNPFVTNYHQ